MNIGWPAALILVIVIIGVVIAVSTWIGMRGAVTAEQAKGKSGEQYRKLAADYETLVKESRDVQAAMQADLVELRTKVDSIERMMREVA
jgi:hypothetical protein